jgi:hypothetical protein
MLLRPYLAIEEKKEEILINELKVDIDLIFEILEGEGVFPVTISGGEPLLYPDAVYSVAEHCLKYKNRISRIKVFTNGTIVPRTDLLLLASKSKGFVSFELDDYGEKDSVKKQEILQKMQKFSIDVNVRKYYGDDQDYGGWGDFGEPYLSRGYSEQEFYNVWSNCHQNKYTTLHNGFISTCCRIAGVHFGGLDKEYSNYGYNACSGVVNLRDKSLTNLQKRESITELLNKPSTACLYCNGFIPNTSKRIPAGIQLLRGET